MEVNPVIEASWKRELSEQFRAPYFAELKAFLIEEKRQYTIFPPGNLIFNAFNLTPFDKVKVVIIGQDPYYNKGQAHGLCFSVQPGVPHPKSLINIFQELKTDVGVETPMNGNLEQWAKQGVLLLNATLTVREHQPGSHQNHGWETFTDAVIRQLSEQKTGIVFLLWGNYAQAKVSLIDTNKHFILRAAHPSPFSAYRGFFNCHHFSQTNQLLIQSGQVPIDWNLA